MAVVVTGAAGGLGSALVDRLLHDGHDVVALDRDRIDRDGVLSRVLDLGDEAAVENVLRDVVAGGRPITHLVAIAGGALRAEKTADDPSRISTEVFRASLEQNLLTAWITVRAALPYLRAGTGDRSILLTSSTDAVASYGMPAYAAAKAGLIGLVHALTGPLGADGIRINAVAPGDVPTPRNEREWAHRADWYTRLAASTALGRLPTPAHIAAAYTALLDLAHVTGQVVVVDGGQTLARPAG